MPDRRGALGVGLGLCQQWGKPKDRHVRPAERGGDRLPAVVVAERLEESPVEIAALDAGQLAITDASRELVGEVFRQGVMAPGVLAADRLGDESRCVRIPLIERDGDLVGAEEGAPEVMP